jgi:hypothetical protein
VGTEHGYTEKECKVCGVTKRREDFPAYGGLTCRDCMRTKERKASPERYERAKQDPKWVEKNRKRARDYKRKKKREREENMSEPPDDDDVNDNVSDDDVEPMDFDEFIDSVAGSDHVDHDEDLLDLTGSGIDVQVPGDPNEQALADVLGAFRDWAKQVPPPSPNDMVGESVSVNENANKLAAIGGRTAASGMVQQLLGQMEGDQAEALAAAGSPSADADNINGAFEQAKESVNNTYQVILAAYALVLQTGQQHGGSA